MSSNHMYLLPCNNRKLIMVAKMQLIGKSKAQFLAAWFVASNSYLSEKLPRICTSITQLSVSFSIKHNSAANTFYTTFRSRTSKTWISHSLNTAFSSHLKLNFFLVHLFSIDPNTLTRAKYYITHIASTDSSFNDQNLKFTNSLGLN